MFCAMMGVMYTYVVSFITLVEFANLNYKMAAHLSFVPTLGASLASIVVATMKQWSARRKDVLGKMV